MSKATEEDWKRLEERLNAVHVWPSPFTFKCIVPQSSKAQMEALFAPRTLGLRESSTGKFLSVTIEFEASCSQEVIDLYRQAETIDGAMLL